VAEPFWGRSIATAALIETTAYAFVRFPFERIQATVFGWNPRSARVLEKAGYALEGRLRNSIFKDGRLTDSLLYARFRNWGAPVSRAFEPLANRTARKESARAAAVGPRIVWAAEQSELDDGIPHIFASKRHRRAPF
jgi:hypothetical protein